MNLPPDKMKLLNQYDNEKKWELICDQERFQVKNPPSAYIQKLKSYLDTGGVSRKFKRRVQESTQVLRELEISLRTNYIGCLVRGGHDIILAAFDNFKEVCGEKNRFEKLMEYFRNEDTNIDFMVACMQFINIVVHSVENMNFRVFLQYEFTHLGLDQYLESLRLTESDKLQVQIQAYLDNVFDVGAMLEDSETKTAVLEHMEELQELGCRPSHSNEGPAEPALGRVKGWLRRVGADPALPQLLEMKSTDRKQTLLHYLVRVITEKYPELTGFHTELHFLDKAGTVSLDGVLQDVRSLQQGMELTRREFLRQDDSPVLKDFLKVNSEVMEKLQADSKTAKEAYESAVEYFGENPKTSPPTTFFPMFMRFIRAYKKAEQDIELWKKQEAAAKEAENSPTEQQPELPIQKAKRQQMDMIAELKKKQMVKEPLIYEGKDGAIEDIISGER
ncbi:formin-like protein 1 [Manacus vitellinus]|uniref:formin-like protein 1 n=1 Tax=Manacus vitellinus TaxID=328815 RepID=UPI00115EF70F|nr:formin-like protein 1 [Manacus vitellinus]